MNQPLYAKPGKNKTIYVKDMLTWIRAVRIAGEEHISMSTLIEKALREYLK